MAYGDDLQRADALINQGRCREAVAMLTRALDDQPDSARGWCLLASCHYLAEDWPAMLKAADRALVVTRRSPPLSPPERRSSRCERICRS